MSVDPAFLRQQFLRFGVRSATELADAGGVSQPTISRALRELSDSLVRIGRGRSARYGLASPIGDLGASWPLYLIGADGSPEQLGILHALLGGSFWLERGTTRWMALTDETFPKDVFPDLPWFLDDYRPQGFLGRAFARKHATELGQEPNPAGWNSRAVVEAMLRFGDDFSGAFVLGKEALRLALQAHAVVVPCEVRDREYPSLAEIALSGDLVGSSAGGEQPKFTIEQSGNDGLRSFIVKFSPEFSEPLGQRWADLLYAEHLAGLVLREHGFIAAQSEVFDAGNRRFLEVERFDRTSENGRRPVISLRSVAAALLDVFGAPWSEMATELLEKKWLTESDAGALASIWRFGKLIANTDMHEGNVSFLLSPEKPAQLASVYDMLPMAYRPDSASGVVPGLSEIQLDTVNSISSASERKMAKSFWIRLSQSTMVSRGFQKIAAAHAVALTSARGIR